MAEQLLTVPQARKMLRLEDSDEDLDSALAGYVAGVLDVVEHEVGWVERRQLQVRIRQGGTAAVLPDWHVLSLDGGVYDDGTAVDVAPLLVDEYGIVRSRSGGSLPLRPWRVTLTVGRDPIPDAIRSAAAEILRVALDSFRFGATDDEQPRPFLIPYRAQAWLAPYSKVDAGA